MDIPRRSPSDDLQPGRPPGRGRVIEPRRSARGPTHARTGHRRRRGILALLAALACLAGFALAELKTSPSAPATPRPLLTSPSGTDTPGAGTAAPRRERLATISWPADGVSAADISGFGVVAGPGAARPVPIASVAKVMTAYVVLHDHPLPGGGSGPDIAVQPSEAAAYPSQARDGDSLVPVAAGERLTERQALEALLLPSADNMAWILARWDAGSQAAFAARMNATARRLGMTGTTYTDPSGLDPSTTSTAADQVRLGMAAMRVPALAAIVATSTAVVPVAGVVRNYNTLLGQDGIAGLKTGSTQAAGGCVLIAAWHKASGRKTLIVAATFGQPGTAETILPNALQAGHNLVLALDHALGPGLRPRPRIRAPRAGPAGNAEAGWRRPGSPEPECQNRAASRLLRRRVGRARRGHRLPDPGQPGRYRECARCRRSGRGRQDPRVDPGIIEPRDLDAWLIGTASALVHNRLPDWRREQLRHVQRICVTGSPRRDRIVSTVAMPLLMRAKDGLNSKEAWARSGAWPPRAQTGKARYLSALH